MKFRLADIVEDSIVDGPGIRIAVFTQGCPHHCPGCHNAHTHDPLGGRDADTDEIFERIAKNPLLSGITLTGGEPFVQCEAMAEIARRAKERHLHVMAYSGYLFEQLLARPEAVEVLKNCDLLVDGPFILSERSLDLTFRGSKNQRIINVPESLKTGQVVLADLD